MLQGVVDAGPVRRCDVVQQGSAAVPVAELLKDEFPMK